MGALVILLIKEDKNSVNNIKKVALCKIKHTLDELSSRAMVVRTLEPWLSKKELCEYLRINKNILEQLYPLFTEGVHFRRKNPLKENSAKVWKATKVDQLLCESSSILTRRLKKIA